MPTAESVISYYAMLARDCRIQFQVQVDYPDDCLVTVTDITVLLGNLLENAVEACRREEGRNRFIKLRVRRRNRWQLLILVDNSCAKTVLFEGGTPQSSKREGAGIGISSICEIAGRYGGAARFEHKDGVFYASVYLRTDLK